MAYVIVWERDQVDRIKDAMTDRAGYAPTVFRDTERGNWRIQSDLLTVHDIHDILTELGLDLEAEMYAREHVWDRHDPERLDRLARERGVPGF